MLLMRLMNMFAIQACTHPEVMSKLSLPWSIYQFRLADSPEPCITDFQESEGNLMPCLTFKSIA